jgi:hypothetical protein
MQLQYRGAPSTLQQQHDLTAPQQDRAEPSSVQQRRETMALDEPQAYSPRLDMSKPCKGKGTSGLLTTRSAKVGKTTTTVLSRQGRRWHDDGAPTGSRVPAWRMEGCGVRTKIWGCP